MATILEHLRESLSINEELDFDKQVKKLGTAVREGLKGILAKYKTVDAISDALEKANNYKLDKIISTFPVIKPCVDFLANVDFDELSDKAPVIVDFANREDGIYFSVPIDKKTRLELSVGGEDDSTEIYLGVSKYPRNYDDDVQGAWLHVWLSGVGTGEVELEDTTFDSYFE